MGTGTFCISTVAARVTSVRFKTTPFAFRNAAWSFGEDGPAPVFVCRMPKCLSEATPVNHAGGSAQCLLELQASGVLECRAIFGAASFILLILLKASHSACIFHTRGLQKNVYCYSFKHLLKC